MEDAHIAQLDVVEGQVHLFGVFDGHGGSEVAKFVGRHFVEELKKNKAFQSEDYKTALIQTFLLMDQMLIADAGKKELKQIVMKSGGAQGMQINQDELPYQAGCTACVALVTNTEIYCANAGDTRCVVSLKGKVKDLSHDHKPDNLPEKRRVEKAGGFVEEGRVNGIIAISRAIGDWEYKNASLKPEDNMVSGYPEVIVEPLRPELEFMLVACDGIWDCMSS